MKIKEIKNPDFLKKMKKADLEILSDDIRQFILQHVSKTGGHLSSNLGIVDLTIAIHKVFNSPKDKIIFDIGHQAYTHKILTGRAKDFNKLRGYQGLSGFLKREESKHDVYEAGHSSTALSAALGFALARDMNKEHHHVIAIIGDGSIANGLAYEAINHLGSASTKLIIILNDNEMSISQNVGALHNTLDKIRVNTGYKKAKSRTQRVLNYLPLIGKPIIKLLISVKHSLMKIYTKEGFLFEEMGLQYFGPINGHDYEELIMYLEMMKKTSGPVILHVITEKGKGYQLAEVDKDGSWHGVGPFDIKTGKEIFVKSNKISFSEVISHHLIRLTKMMKDIIVISPAMVTGSKLGKYQTMFPHNFIDVGIAEEHALVLACGLAINHKKPFVSIYSTFLQRGYDAVSHDIARMKLPVVIGIDRAGIVGGDGDTHQGIYDVAFLSHIPNLIIMAPKDSTEAGNLLYTAFKSGLPCAIRYAKTDLEYQKIKYQTVSIGSWEEISSGEEVTIITYGEFIQNAVQIKEMLLKDQINTRILNARFIKPFNQEYLNEILTENKLIFVYEEVVKLGSLGSMISSYAHDNGYQARIISIGIKDEFIPQGSREELLKMLELDTKSVYERIKKEVIANDH